MNQVEIDFIYQNNHTQFSHLVIKQKDFLCRYWVKKFFVIILRSQYLFIYLFIFSF